MKFTLGHKVLAASVIGATAAVAGVFALTAVANQAVPDSAATTSLNPGEGTYINDSQDSSFIASNPKLVEKDKAAYGEGSLDVQGTPVRGIN